MYSFTVSYIIILIFQGAKPHLVSGAHADHTRKELMRMLSMRISSWRVCSGYASVPDAYAQLVLKGLRSVHVFGYRYNQLPCLIE